MRSVSSALRVRTNRSAKQFARGKKRRNSHHVDTGIGQDSIERRGELSGAVSDEESELGDAIAEIHHQIADLLGGPSAIGVVVGRCCVGGSP